jgi:hypothetical protein
MPDHLLARARAKRARASSNPTKNQNSARRSIDVVRDLGSGEGRRSRLLRLGRGRERARDDCRGHDCEVNPQHGRFSLM